MKIGEKRGNFEQKKAPWGDTSLLCNRCACNWRINSRQLMCNWRIHRKYLMKAPNYTKELLPESPVTDVLCFWEIHSQIIKCVCVIILGPIVKSWREDVKPTPHPRKSANNGLPWEGCKVPTKSLFGQEAPQNRNPEVFDQTRCSRTFDCGICPE